MADMADRWRTQDGSWSVEVVTLSHTPDRHDGTGLRVRRGNYFIADVRDLDDLARYVALEELEEALRGAARDARAAPPAGPAVPLTAAVTR
jgi:hypothetical protein